jgi:phospholipid/cholesterol/gamma-HCH transport system substrate-binding protein
MTKFRWHVVTVLLAAGVAIAWGIFWLWNANALPSLGDDYDVSAEVPDAASLAPNAGVRIAGLDVGKVTSIDHERRAAVLGLEIDDDQAPIPEDSRVRVRLRTLVGENYVELQPGSSDSDLPDGGTLPLNQAGELVDVEAILSALRGKTRQRAREFIQGLGSGVRDRGPELNRFLAGASGTIEEGSAVVRTLARDREQVARLIENFGDVARAVGDRGTSLRQLARGLRVSFESVAARDRAVRAMLDEFPSTLRQVRETSATVRSVTGDAAPVLSNLAAAVRELKPTVDLLKPASEEGRGLVRELGRSAEPLRETLRRVRELSGPTARALPEVRQTLCEFNPTAEFLAPYGTDVGNVLANMASSANFYDAKGHAVRLTASVSEDSVAVWDEQTNRAASELLDSGLLGELHDAGYNPLPGPLGVTAPFTKSRAFKQGVGVTGPSDYPFPYPRVEAECGR